MKKLFTTSIILGCMIFNATAQIIHVPGDQPSIQAGIDAAVDGDTVLVADSTYFENINFSGKAITVASHFLVDGDIVHISKTIIDGSQPDHPDTASVVRMVSGEDTTSVLCGFTITGGKGTYKGNDLYVGLFGGGVFVFRSGGKIEHNIIMENHLVDQKEIDYVEGAGICATVNDSNTVIIRHNIVQNNSGTGHSLCWGGGIGIYGGSSVIQDNMVSNNIIHGKEWGGAAGIGYGFDPAWVEGIIPEAIISNNIITGNETFRDEGYARGTGLYVNGRGIVADLQIFNNLIADNHGHGGWGGGLGITWIEGVVVFNNTIVNNKSEINGKQLMLHHDTKVILYNNVLWSDEDDGISDIYYQPYENNVLIARYNSIKGGWGGVGNIPGNPRFAGDSYELSDSSMCVGYGVDSLLVDSKWYYAPATDFAGNVRPHGIDPYIDLGAFEAPYTKLPSADLAHIGLWNRVLRPSFDKDTLAYILDLPDTVSVTPQLDVVPFDWSAEVDIDPASNLPDPVSAEDSTSTITVTSYDGGTTKTYTVVFNRLSADATLKELIVSRGMLSPVFDPQELNYFVDLPYGSTETPLTTCEVADPAASVKIDPAQDITDLGSQSKRTTFVTVTAEDPAFKKTYQIEFNVDRFRPVLSLTSDTVRLDENILVSSTEDGYIYLVPMNTEGILDSIVVNQLESAMVTALDIVSLPASDLEDSTSYLLYGVDASNSISVPVTVTIIPAVGTGTQEIISAAVRLYPVPVEDVLTIETSYQLSSFELFNAIGVRVMYAELSEDRIHLAHLERGVYIIRIKTDQGSIYTGKLIKK